MSALTPQIVTNTQTGAQTITTTTETVVATVVVGTAGPFDIAFQGVLDLTLGATVTGCTLRVRRDSVAGAVVGQPEVWTIPVGTVPRATMPIAVVDPVRDCAGATYVLTITQAGATGNGTVNMAQLTAFTR